ncbi:EAL domain-containing protein [Halomonas sp. TRM85114]|uniref:putative bifunctional diguanylate cyclase/phosphodiesterase n=1 Tax=Halomonas jincaotanensis TaxID=2810616 RepID=UPI001BD41E26|nr:EAL domain-containing protein [Halomonas jincaotanensis]MBS9404597.1 EAL domain-containing protein [Halomonas jincaotanensis]
MTSREHKLQKPPVMIIALANMANARLLDRMLGAQFHLQHTLAEEDDETLLEADLIVADTASLQHNRERILHMRRRAAPNILPVLLVADSRSRLPPRITAELGHSVDDILRIPTNQAELQARIDNLLRLRTLSHQQETNRQQLVGVVSALRTLNACDRVIVRSKNEDEMLSSLCRTIVAEEGYNLAWVGFAIDRADKPIEVRASAGPAAGFLSELTLGWGSDAIGSGPAGQSIRSGRVRIVDDITSEPALAHFAERARAHRLASAISLPLIFESGLPGCLSIYSRNPGHFGPEERQLLERLADNLVFGLNALRTLREREHQSAEIHYLAYTDALTGLPNRRHLVHYLDGMLEANDNSETSGAVLFIDLDRFKLINDALGHEVGDQVLVQIAQRLQGAVRNADQVIRQGGDEFLVLMINDPRQGGTSTREQIIINACALADRIIAHLGAPMLEGGFTHHIGASVGISLYPDHGRNATTLIENADKAMFEAKRQGSGGRMLFSEDLSANRQQRFAMESRLRKALDNEEFELHYQPIFELDSCRIVAVEALIRWPQADGKILMPGAFMSVVEETGMIKPLGDWILETAARQLKAWHDQGYMLAMSVNVSLNQLYPGCIAESFAALVKPHVDPRWIHLEVTENALMVDPEAIETLLEELHAQGFQLAIDDFGTGYSSLSRLQHLSIQTLKIDRSFTNELGQPGSKGAALVAIIQQMAASLNLYTIAEGIETDEQRQFLLEMAGVNCWGQGFWFSCAIPANELVARLRDQQET